MGPFSTHTMEPWNSQAISSTTPNGPVIQYPRHEQQ